MKRDAQEIVTNAKLLLKDEMSNISFITWINPLELEDWTDSTIVFKVNSSFQRVRKVVIPLPLSYPEYVFG